MSGIFSLALKSLWHRRVATVLTIVSISLSVSLFVGVGRTKEATRDAFSGAISRVDLIVGPRSGTLSLLLYSVFHVGSPTHSVSMKAVEFAKNQPEVDWVVPFSMGDGFKGFPVVGTTAELFERYKYRDGNAIRFAAGQAFQKDDEATIGSDVARSLGLTMGAKIVLSHGHTEDGDGFEKHEDHPFSVVGVLEPTGTPLDRSVFVSLVGMAEIHRELIAESSHDHEDEHPVDTREKKDLKGHEHHDHADDHGDSHDDSHDDDHKHADSSFKMDGGKLKVTAVSGFFLGAKNRMESLNLQRKLNTWEGDALLAILPGMAMAELWKNLSIFETALSIVSFCVVIAGMLGLFVSLYIASGYRRREMMILRAVGASPLTIFSMLAGEAVFLVLAGIFCGAGLMYAGLAMLAPWIERKFSVAVGLVRFSTEDFWFAFAMVIVGCVAGVLASINAYRSAMHDGLGTRF
jgi:putative ABC transport system permease protein